MNFIETPIKDLLIIEPKVWKDDRGYFYESYSKKLFESNGIDIEFVQDNQSLSHLGALRGLHAQSPPFAQGKLVRVMQGKVLDVAVDIRKNSPTYGQNFTIELSGENHRILWIPAGFVHGFVTLENNTIFTYKVSELYDKASEIGLRWNDPDLNIAWGIDATDAIISDKDKMLPFLKDFISPF